MGVSCCLATAAASETNESSEKRGQKMKEWKWRVGALKRHRHYFELSFILTSRFCSKGSAGCFQLNKQSEEVIFCPFI